MCRMRRYVCCVCVRREGARGREEKEANGEDEEVGWRGRREREERRENEGGGQQGGERREGEGGERGMMHKTCRGGRNRH